MDFFKRICPFDPKLLACSLEPYLQLTKLLKVEESVLAGDMRASVEIKQDNDYRIFFETEFHCCYPDWSAMA